MSNKSHKIEWLPIHPGKKTFHQRVRMDLSPEERKDYDAACDQIAFYTFVTALTGEKFRKHRSAILGKIAAEDLMLKVSRGLRTIISGDAASLICQAVNQKDEAFFKAFLKTLIGQKVNSGAWDTYNLAILRLIYDGNTDSGRRKLKEDFPDMEKNFRVYRDRLLDMLPPKYQYLDHRKKQRKPPDNKRNKNVKLLLRRHS